jgi:PAS domain S-box-containing protein
MAIYTTDAEGRITSFNKAAEELWGRAPEDGDLWNGSLKLFDGDDAPLPHDACPMAIALRDRREVRDIEAVLERPDGTRIPFLPYPTPLRDEGGEMVGAVNMLVDITHHKEASERQQLLINELNHRVKNTLALVQSIAGLTIRSSETLAEFRGAFEKRLGALSRAHDLLNRTWWGAVPLRAVLEAELAPFGERGRVELVGDDVALSPRQGIALTLILHELATNAAKHGALSVSKGRLRVAWERAADTSEVILAWDENDGPAVDAPTRKGFGSKLIDRSVKGDLGGRLEQHFDIAGYRCVIRFSLAP